MLVRSFVAVVAVLIVVGACCSSGTGSLTPGGGGGGTSPNTKVGKVGDTITVDGVACTLMSAAIWESNNQFVTPKDGNLFVKVIVKLHNGGTNEVRYSALDFHAKSSSGNITDYEITTNNDDLDRGRLAAGGTTQGAVIFQIPQGDHGAQLTWQPSFFGEAGQNAWLLGL